jgi:radical SAM superfamily enzyme YgiQ (UPF0313 family)
MKILLIKHPTIHFRHTAPPVSGIPLGLLYVAAALQKSGHHVRVYDAIVDAPEKKWGFREHGQYIQMGATWEDIQKVVEQEQPDVVGIGNQYSSQAISAIQTAEAIKKIDRNITVIVGGPHATVMPSTFLYQASPIDYAVMGEGEIATTELLECLSAKRSVQPVKGLAYYAQGKLVVNAKSDCIENLDQLPLPAYELIDLEKYFYFNKKGLDGRERYQYPGSERSISMITSRGCPFNCVFCSIHLVMGQKFRPHSVSFVLEHIKLLKERFKVKHIHFEDDNISFNISRFENILDGMLTQDFKMTWDAPNGVRADYLDENIIKKCRVSGCAYLRIGVESADEYVSKEIIKKRLDQKSIINTAKACLKVGVDLEGFYIIGFPGETISQMKKTIDFALNGACRYGMYPYDIFTATPLIGSELYKICQENGYFSKDVSPQNLAMATQGEGMIATNSFSPADLKKLLKFFRLKRYIAMTIFFLKFLMFNPKYIFIRLCQKSFLNQQITLIKQRRLFDLLEGFFMYRYRNCVLRRIGCGK